MSSLMDKMLKAGSVKHATILQDSKFFTDSDLIPTDLPILNIAFSADLKGGLTPGLTFFAGESKSFKTLLALFCMKAYLEKYPDAIAIFYDSEYGTTPDYLISNGIDPKRILHVPIEHIEQLKFDINKRLSAIERNEKIFILIDSIGNLASVKEVEDANNEKSVADMSRAKALKSLFRIVTPMIVSKNIPCVAINHVYKEMSLYPATIMGGGCLIEGTEIQTLNGYEEIQNVNVGDIVKTLSGYNTVTHTWNPETLDDGEPECYEIVFEDGTHVQCSAQHRFLIDGQWIEAKDMIEGMKCETLTE